MCRRWSSLGTACFLTLVTLANAQTAPTVDLEEIKQTQPGFLVRVAVDHADHQYRAGDQLTLTVTSESDAFLYVLYQQADGRLYQVFPNRRQSEGRIRAGQPFTIPARDDLFRWTVGAPFGKEVVKVIATSRPLRALAPSAPLTKDLTSVPQSTIASIVDELGGQPTALRKQLRDVPPPPPLPMDGSPVPDNGATHPEQMTLRWAEADVEIHTSQAPPPPRRKQRFGVFFGVADYKFDAFAQLATGQSQNLAAPAADAALVNRVMIDPRIGRLQDSRVYTNSQATRHNLQKAICEWLPGISRPGDTVVIYFSGHGGQIEDDNGDEKDGRDEYLLPHDALGSSAMRGILELQQRGQLPEELKSLANTLTNLARRLGPRRAAQFLVRETCVTDDLFGHWLQRLDGRQVVVILDICHSGGFATLEKSVGTAVPQATFDFVDQEMDRLKDIGQDHVTLLTACATAELSLEGVTGRQLGVMTSFLADVLSGQPGPLDVQTVHMECASRMAAFFRSDKFQAVNNRLRQAGREPYRPHHPQLYESTISPVYLKP
ncbi:MAG: DUF4384 domain-containing protein [Planctomycetes bacterium]|nr:DUF4384 domain-containing protein [Planctomycetota bacterium]